MKMLEDRIRKDGIVREGNVLKVDSFINHQMDIPLFKEMAREWKRLFDGKPINKVLTIEASGIGIAVVVASEFNVPVVFAKKSMSINLDYDNYETKIQSFTHKKIYNVIVSKNLMNNGALMVEQGLGYAIGVENVPSMYDPKRFCYRELSPEITTGSVLVWKKDQPHSRAAEEFLKFVSMSIGHSNI